jgi:ribosomal protein S18 acetylase RimI-like enzyme
MLDVSFAAEYQRWEVGLEDVRILPTQGADVPANEVLDLQRRCLIGVVERPSESGFLVTSMTRPELDSLIESGAKVFAATSGSALIAYLLLCPPKYVDGMAPHFSPLSGEGESAFADLDYLFQVVVDPAHRRAGIATRLVRAAQTAAKRGLLADVLLTPIRNEPSLSFFVQVGFGRLGTFTFDDYPGFGPHTAAVFAWRR